MIKTIQYYASFFALIKSDDNQATGLNEVYVKYDSLVLTRSGPTAGLLRA